MNDSDSGLLQDSHVDKSNRLHNFEKH